MSYAGKVEAGGELGLIGTTLFGICSTAATTPAKTVIIDGLDTVFTGLTVHVQFTNSNRAEAPTFRIQNSGIDAKPIYRNGNTRPGTTEATSWMAGAVLDLTYDGVGWQITGWLNTDTNTTYEDATESEHGLMPSADKVKLNKLSIITYTDIAVPAASWVTEVTPTYAGYSFKAVLTITGATAAHVPTVVFTPEQVKLYGPAPVAVSGDGTVTIFAENKPTDAITIPTIQLAKGETG